MSKLSKHLLKIQCTFKLRTLMLLAALSFPEIKRMRKRLKTLVQKVPSEGAVPASPLFPLPFLPADLPIREIHAI
jgi:hypothetical protein